MGHAFAVKSFIFHQLPLWYVYKGDLEAPSLPGILFEGKARTVCETLSHGRRGMLNMILQWKNSDQKPLFLNQQAIDFSHQRRISYQTCQP
jgi:hypothetical protein